MAMSNIANLNLTAVHFSNARMEERHFAMIIRIAAIAAVLVTATPAAAAAIPWLATVADSYPSVSPDGKTIVFQTNRPGRQALFIADVGGKNVRPFLDNGHDPGTPMWSPDGKL